MAKLKLNGLFSSIKGKIGDFHIRRHGKDFFLARNPTPSKVPKTELAKKNRRNFGRAVEYAKGILGHSEKLARYDKVVGRRPRRTWNLLISDFRLKPEVHEIDVTDYTGSPGDVITIEATDNVHVAAVRVELKDADGEVIEQGEAERLPDSLWAYTATESVPPETSVQVAVTARDLPGGTHTRATNIVV